MVVVLAAESKPTVKLPATVSVLPAPMLMVLFSTEFVCPRNPPNVALPADKSKAPVVVLSSAAPKVRLPVSEALAAVNARVPWVMVVVPVWVFVPLRI